MTKRSRKKAEAVEFLRDELPAGPVAATEIKKRANAAGHTHKAIRMARKALGIKPTKAGFDAGWMLELPTKGPTNHEGAPLQEWAPSTPEGPFGSPLSGSDDGADHG